ncbi:MAG: InlB B-repeat-containing protein [Parasporobacterium sp.]|nr:InlB B-repeat-containing protein [Parasporobacterium sp.]
MTVKAKSYDGKVTLKNAFQDENGTVYAAGKADKGAIAGKMLMPYEMPPGTEKYQIRISEGIPADALWTDLKEAEEGTLVTITYNPESGIILNEITVISEEGENPEVTKVNDTTYTFLMPASDVTVVGDTYGSECIIIFDSDGGSFINDQAISFGGKAVRPEDPVKEGYAFDGWYRVIGETMSEVPFDFDTQITEPEILLKAKWKAAGTPADKSPATSDPQNALIWIIMMLAVVVMISLIGLLKVKKK